MQYFLSYLFNSLLCLLKSEVFWVFFGSIVTAFALIYSITQNLRNKKQEIENIKKSLYFEILLNIEMIFSGEVERNSLFEVNKLIRTKYIDQIKNQDEFIKIQSLYSELDYYNKIVNNFYLNNDLQKAGLNTGAFVTQKQLSTCNKFLDFFEEDEVMKLENETYDEARNRAIKKKNKKINKWKKKLNMVIEEIFS